MGQGSDTLDDGGASQAEEEFAEQNYIEAIERRHLQLKSSSERYNLAKAARVGTIIKCPNCEKPFTKKTYNQTFCSNSRNSPFSNCKDKFWNSVDPDRRFNAINAISDIGVREQLLERFGNTDYRPLPPTVKEEIRPGNYSDKLDNLTIFTDASYDNMVKVAGAGFWIVYGNHQKVVGSLSLPYPMHKSSLAELTASIEVIKLALSNPAISKWISTKGRVRIVLVVDALSVKHAFEIPTHSEHSLTKSTVDMIKSHGHILKINHVPGHKTDKKARTYVNNTCDKLAKKAMNKLRQEIISGEYNV